jgi:poly(hydroxyalkanoate) granule-associated protein
MARKQTNTRRAPKATPARALQNLRNSALGAVDAVLKQGVALGMKGRRMALATAREASAAVASRAGDARLRTVEAVSQLERAFEQRVARAVTRLGVPSSRDVRALSRQVAQLQVSVDRLRRTRARAQG